MAGWDEGVKLAICYTANHDQIRRDFPVMITRMLKPRQWILSCKGAHIKSSSLNEQLTEAANQDCTHVLFLDVDMQFPEYTIPRLLMDFQECPDVGMIGGMYHVKSTPYSPIAGWIDQKNGDAINGRGVPWKTDYYPLPENKVVEVHWTGIGCLMADMKIFDKIYFPPFKDNWNEEEGVRQKGHDVILCEAVRAAGYKIYVDTRVDCMHIGDLYVNKAWVEAYHKADMDNVILDTVKDFAAESTWWDEIWMDANIRNVGRRKEPILKVLREHIPKEVAVADFGCGDGGLLVSMRDELGCDVYGYDFSHESIRFINRFGIKGEVADIRNFNVNGESYHTVLFSHILEHLLDKDIPNAMKVISGMSEEQAFIIVPKEPFLHIEHKKIYDEDMLRETVEPYFEDVDIKSIEGSSDMPEGYKHIVAHCRKPIRQEADFPT